MDFSYTEEQLAVRDLADKLFTDLASIDYQRQLDEQGCRFDPALWEALAKAGLLGVAIDESSGGMGFDFETLCLLIEEAGKHVAGVPLIPCMVGVAPALAESGASGFGQTLAGIASGQMISTLALLEPGNENPASPQLRAEVSEAGWRLSGVKHCVPYGRQS